MDNKKLIHEIIRLFEEHGFRKKKDSIEILNDILLSEEWNPLSIVDIFKGNHVLTIATYDDCNIYAEEGYYKTILSKITQHSKKKCYFSDISEYWEESGNIILSFKLNGILEKICFNTEEHDMVPALFLAYIKETLLDYNGAFRYIYHPDYEYDQYYRLPLQLINQLEQLNVIQNGYD